MPELPDMNVQMPLQNTKPTMETASQLTQPSATAGPGTNPFIDIN